MTDPDLVKPYFADSILPNSEGHVLLADVLISYFQSQVCATWSTAGGHSYETIPLVLTPSHSGDTHLFGGIGARKGGAPPEPPKAVDENAAPGKKAAQFAAADSHLVPLYPELLIPPSRINTRPRATRPFEEPAPFCASANDLVNPVPPSLFYGSGWHAAHPKQGTSPLLTAEYYWHSWMPLSTLRVPIKTGAGEVGIYYLKEPIEDIEEGSQLKCWVDDNIRGAVILENAGNVPSPVPVYVFLCFHRVPLLRWCDPRRLQIIDHFVTRGSHYVDCIVLGDEGQAVPSFKIIGIFAT